MIRALTQQAEECGREVRWGRDAPEEALVGVEKGQDCGC